MTGVQTFFAIFGLLSFITIGVLVWLHCLEVWFVIAEKWKENREKMLKRHRVNGKLPVGWGYNFDKVIDVYGCRAFRVDGAYITVGEFGFLYFHWDKYEISTQVSHWNPETDLFDLCIPGNMITSTAMADEWFPADKEVTEDKVYEYYDFRSAGGDKPTIHFQGRQYWKKREAA